MWTCPKCETNNRDGDMNCFVCACDYKTYLEYRTVKQKEAAEAAAKVRAEEAAARARAAVEAAAKTKAAIASDELKALAKAAEAAEASGIAYSIKESETPPKTEAKPAAEKKPSEASKPSAAPAPRRTYTEPKKKTFAEKHPTIAKILVYYLLIMGIGVIISIIYEGNNSDDSSSTYKRRSALYPAAYACEQLEYAPDAEYFSLCLSPADTSYMIFEEDSYVDLSEM